MNVGGSVVARRFPLVHMLLILHMIGGIDGRRVRAGGRAA